MMSFWRTVRDRLESDGRVFIALVVDHSIHSPGTTGARLAVFESGETLGTVGGGIMERNLVARAPAAFSDQDFEPELRTLYHRKHGDGEKSGLICAGYQTNLCLMLEREQALAELEQAVERERDQGGFLEITPPGIRFQQDSDLADGEQSRLVAEVDRADKTGGTGGTGEADEAGGTGEAGEADAWHYVERLVNLRRVAILGGGHCGLALSRILHGLGYYVSIFDTRPRVPTFLENDFADRKEIVADFSGAAAMVDFADLTSVVVMTTGLPTDIQALSGALARPFPFVGVMGSLTKIAEIKHALRAGGVDEAEIARIVAPVGLPMRSNTPEEIAVSVAAQLLERAAQSE